MIEHEILEWDSQHFGYPVANIRSGAVGLRKSDVESVLSELKRLGVRLAYWPVSNNRRTFLTIAADLGGALMDKRATYQLRLGNVGKPRKVGAPMVTEYQGRFADDELIDLAIQSGEHSRFRIDPHFSEKQFRDLYTIWIQRSVAGALADAVFVLHRESGRLAGMITVGIESGIGKIGLIAVDSTSRGKNYGKYLLASANEYCQSNGCGEILVNTQSKNKAACGLYKSGGYRLRNIQDIYHFWL